MSNSDARIACPSCSCLAQSGLEARAYVGKVPRQLWGLLTHRERWGLSWKGWSLLVIAFAAGFVCWLTTVHSFLATTQRVDADLLVVEGWVHDFAIRAAIQEFHSGSYRLTLTTGGPVAGTGHYTSDYNTTASIGANRLRALGMPSGSVEMIPSRVIGRDRTYNSATALREWLRDNGVSVKRINVLTESVHARRTWLLFQKAFGNQVSIGIISAANPDYDPKRWWDYSEGVREVTGETIAYLYAKLFFHPSKQSLSAACTGIANMRFLSKIKNSPRE